MKKINVLSRVLGGMKVKKVLMIFSFFLLFGFGFNSANAQYVSQEDAISILVQEVNSLDNNMAVLFSSGNTTEVQRAEFKIQVFKTMVEKLENGNSVKKVIDETIGVPNTPTSIDAQLINKEGSNQWLIDEILELLTL